MTILAKPAILAARDKRELLIEPFNPKHVKNASVDVTLGPWYWLETNPMEVELTGTPIVIPSESGSIVADLAHVLNPFDERSVRRMWGEKHLMAQPMPQDLPGIPKGTLVIPVHPGQNILAGTEQFIGSSDSRIDTQMQARSSVGRNQVTVCRCAGKGDIGFANRWTMEISNNGNRTVLLVVGRRIAQIVFKLSTGCDSDDVYFRSGKYQSRSLIGLSLEELEAQWTPEDMLPKMYLDDEVFQEIK